MTIQTIKLGNYANDGTGDDLRTAFTKVNSNFTELYGEAAISTARNIGGGIGVFIAKDGINLNFKTLVAGNYPSALGPSIVLTDNVDHTITINAITKLEADTHPKVAAPIVVNNALTNPLNLNRNAIVNGDSQTTVWGYDLMLLNSTVQLMLESRQINMDFGSFNTPTGYSNPNLLNGYDLDFGSGQSGFTSTPPNNQVNFGTFV